MDAEQIQRGLELALKALAQEKSEGIAHQIKPVLLANLDRGRLQTFVDENPARIQAYVWLLAQTFTRLESYLHKLQKGRDAETWAPLFERMQTWAYNFLLRKNFRAEEHTREIAIECATDAAVTILNAHFPYDTEFDPWAHIIVQNACRKHIHKALKKSVVPEDIKIELDEQLSAPNELLLETSALQNESGRELQEALEQLPEARRTVIRSIYFDEMEPEEVAQRMGKTVGAVYSLQFHALHDLRKIFGANRDNTNE